MKRSSALLDININSNYRDMGEILIMFMNNEYRDVYRVTFNVYDAITAVSGTTIAASGSATIFIEKLD